MSKLYGLIGEKLGHSISPQIHRLIFEKLQIEAQYKKYEIEKIQLEKFIFELDQSNIKGINVTIPYKEVVMRFLDSCSEEAMLIGAVNTIKVINNRLEGYNTDYYGFKTIIDRNNIALEDRNIFILGTGGAAKAVYTYMKSQPTKKIHIVSRNANDKHLHSIYKDADIVGYKELEVFKSLDILINTTPVGMYPNVDNSPINLKNQTCDYCIDLIYNPSETKLLAYAKSKGSISINGLEMLVAQAIKAEEIWGDFELSVSEMDKLLSEILIQIESEFK